jgi:sulfopyruvate decarboxylase TPP-binding subunit
MGRRVQDRTAGRRGKDQAGIGSDIASSQAGISKVMNKASSQAQTWHDIVLETLKSNNVRLAVYVPDRVLTPLIKALHADDFFTTFACTRDEEALGIVAGAWMGGMRATALMQTSGFATLPNTLASLIVPCQIPALLFVSERGTLGEFNLGQAMVCRTMRPVLDSLGMAHHTITRQDELAFIVDRSIKQAVATQAPVTFILSPLLTGGKVFSA